MEKTFNLLILFLILTCFVGCQDKKMLHSNLKEDIHADTLKKYNELSNNIHVVERVMSYPRNTTMERYENDFHARSEVPSSLLSLFWDYSEHAGYTKNGKLLTYENKKSCLLGIPYSSGETLTRVDDEMFQSKALSIPLFFNISVNDYKNEDDEPLCSTSLLGLGLLYFNINVNSPKKLNKFIEHSALDNNNVLINWSKDDDLTLDDDFTFDTKLIGLGILYHSYKDNDSSSHNYLLGMFGHGSDEGKSYFKLLWIPIYY